MIRALETGILLLENQVTADFFGYYCRIVTKKCLGRSWDISIALCMITLSNVKATLETSGKNWLGKDCFQEDSVK